MIENYEINGKERKVELEYTDVGELKALHLKSYFSKKGKAKELLISEVKVLVEPPPSSDGEPKEYEFKNIKKIKLTKNIPSFLINIDGDKPK